MAQETSITSEATTARKAGFRVRVESHCIGCNTCVQVCEPVFALTSGSSDEQKSYVKEDAPLEQQEENIDTAVMMCPVTAIVKESN